MSENMRPVEFEFLPETDVFGGPVGYRQYVDQTAEEIIAEDAASELIPEDWLEEIVFPDMVAEEAKTRPTFTRKHYTAIAGPIKGLSDNLTMNAGSMLEKISVYGMNAIYEQEIRAIACKLEVQVYYINYMGMDFHNDNPKFSMGKWREATNYSEVRKCLDDINRTLGAYFR